MCEKHHGPSREMQIIIIIIISSTPQQEIHHETIFTVLSSLSLLSPTFGVVSNDIVRVKESNTKLCSYFSALKFSRENMRRYHHPRSLWWSKKTIAALMIMIQWMLLALIPTVVDGLMDATENETNSSTNSSNLMILLGRHEDWIHAQVYETRDDVISHESIDSLVCHPLMKSLQNALPQYESSVVCEDSKLVDLRPFRTQRQATDAFVPLATWTIPLRVPTRVGWMPPPLPSEYATIDWKFYVWDEARAQGLWRDEATSRESASSPALQSFMDQVFTPKSKSGSNSIRLEGKLSESGGMHRKFHQTLRVGLPQTGPTLRAIANILVLLPPDLFVNIEEAVEKPNESLLKSFRVLDVPPGRVIDQEEPSFASPSHGVLIQFEFPADEERAEVKWDLLLHTRYPKPLHQADFSLLALMPPVVWSMQVVRDDESVVGRVPCPWVAPDSTPHYTWVAAGRKEDFVPVMTITTIAALAGSAVMLRALAKAARPVE